MDNKAATFSEAELADNNAAQKGTLKGAPVPEVTTEAEFRYFKEMQEAPMTVQDMVSFGILVAFPTVFFIIAVVLMHHYND